MKRALRMDGSICLGPKIVFPNELYGPCQQENAYFICVDREGWICKEGNADFIHFTELGISVVSAKRMKEFIDDPSNDCKSARDLVSACGIETFSIRNRDHFKIYKGTPQPMSKAKVSRINLLVQEFEERGQKVPEDIRARASAVDYITPSRDCKQYSSVKWADNDDCPALVRETLAGIKQRLNTKTADAKFYLVEFGHGVDSLCLSRIYRGFENDFHFEGTIELQALSLFVCRKGVFSNPNYQTDMGCRMMPSLAALGDLTGLRFEAVNLVDEAQDGVEKLYHPEDLFGNILHSGSNDTVYELSLLAFLLRAAVSRKCRREYTEKMKDMYLKRFSYVTGIGLINPQLAQIEAARPEPFTDYPHAALLTVENPTFDLTQLHYNLMSVFQEFCPETITVVSNRFVWLTFDTKEKRDRAVSMSTRVKVRAFMVKETEKTMFTAKSFDPETKLSHREKRGYSQVATKTKVGCCGITTTHTAVYKNLSYDMDAILAYGERPYDKWPESDSEDEEVWDKRKPKMRKKTTKSQYPVAYYMYCAVWVLAYLCFIYCLGSFYSLGSPISLSP